MVFRNNNCYAPIWHLLIILIVSTYGAGVLLKCLSCLRAPSLEFCDEMETCDSLNEVCFVEQTKDYGGEIVVSAGCKRKEQCNKVGCFGISQGGNVSSECHHCCAGDFCNMHGCPYTYDMNKLQGMRCMKCDHVVHPKDCVGFTTCDIGESCAMEKLAFNQEERYSLYCMDNKKCDLLDMIHGSQNTGRRKKRSYVQVWAGCCHSHLCNGYKPMLNVNPVASLPTYTCPQATTQPPTTTTTTTLTTRATTTTPKTTQSTTITPKPTKPSTTTTTSKPTTTSTTMQSITTTQIPSTTQSTTTTQIPTTSSTTQSTTNTPITTTSSITRSTTTTQIPTTASTTQSTTTASTTRLTTTTLIPTTASATQLASNSKSPSTMSTIQSTTVTQVSSTASTTQSTTVSPTSTSPVTISTEEPCIDNLPDCDSYDFDYLCNSIAMINCKKFCKMCGNGTSMATYTVSSSLIPSSSVAVSSSSTLSTSAACLDKDDSCSAYGRDLLCLDSTYQDYAKENCALYCGFCGGTTAETTRQSIQTAAVTSGIFTASTTKTNNSPIITATAGQNSTKSTAMNNEGTTAATLLSTEKPTSESVSTTQMPQTTATAAPSVQTATTAPSTKTTTTSAPSVQTTTAVAQETCTDAAPDCAEYDKKYICSDEYKDWATLNCKQYCGYCTKPCVDVDLQCSEYGKNYICTGEYRIWAEQNCAKFCGLCPQAGGNGTNQADTGGAQGPAGDLGQSSQASSNASTSNTTNTSVDIECVDVDSNCSAYQQTDICFGEYQPWALLHCRQFCNLCHIDPPCFDAIEHCAQYGDFCTPEYLSWSKLHCRRYCNLCDTGTTQTPTEFTTIQSNTTMSNATKSPTTSQKP